MKNELPTIARHAARIYAALYDAVNRFQRRHKYAIGAELVEDARDVTRCVLLAWRDRNRQLMRVRELSAAVDELKVSMMLAKDVNAFGSMREFEAISRLVVDLGKQVGGWLKALHSKGQNGQADRPPSQRVQTLSSHAASAEATL